MSSEPVLVFNLTKSLGFECDFCNKCIACFAVYHQEFDIDTYIAYLTSCTAVIEKTEYHIALKHHEQLADSGIACIEAHEFSVCSICFEKIYEHKNYIFADDSMNIW